jgi:hypothetical protein
MYELSKGLFKDVIFTFPAELVGSQHPLVIKYEKARQKFAPQDRFGPTFGAGFFMGELMGEGLKRSGRDLTVDNFVKAMESIKDFKGIGPNVSFGPNQRQGTRAFFIAKCADGGKAVRLTDWIDSEVDIQEVIKRLR